MDCSEEAWRDDGTRVKGWSDGLGEEDEGLGPGDEGLWEGNNKREGLGTETELNSIPAWLIETQG